MFGQPLLMVLLLMSSVLIPACHSVYCNQTCGNLQLPFPFHINNTSSSCSGGLPPSFLLTCANSTTLSLTIDSHSYRVLHFFPDALLLDFPSYSSSSCRQYNDLNSFSSFTGNSNFALSPDNVIALYDCEDSSLCKPDCDTLSLPSCDGTPASPACCYPLSDHTSSWDSPHHGFDFDVFSNYGCRGFSSWALPPGPGPPTQLLGKRGVKLEWALSANSSNRLLCAGDADVVNATTVEGGVRCTCRDGFLGDGYVAGTGCFKTCVKDGTQVQGNDCSPTRRSGKMVSILAGVLGPIFVIASLTALLCLLKRPGPASGTASYQTNRDKFRTKVSLRKPWTTARAFTYVELEEATSWFEQGQKLTTNGNGGGEIYAGVLADGSKVAVHKVECREQRDLSQVLSRIEVLSSVSHRNMARIVGCCIDYSNTPLVVYEFPGNGTLDQHLCQKLGDLDWYRRLTIAVETASVLAFLQQEVVPPIFHHNLRSECLFLDDYHSARVSGFRLHIGHEIEIGLVHHKSDVYDFGVLLMEMIGGTKLPAAAAMQKMRKGKVEEMVDPNLYYHEQPAYKREQMEAVADLATRCLLFGGGGGGGKIGMVEVAKELVHIAKESIGGGSKRSGPALEETFSNSSLLQMISMSPDSVHVP